MCLGGVLEMLNFDEKKQRKLKCERRLRAHCQQQFFVSKPLQNTKGVCLRTHSEAISLMRTSFDCDVRWLRMVRVGANLCANHPQK